MPSRQRRAPSGTAEDLSGKISSGRQDIKLIPAASAGITVYTGYTMEKIASAEELNIIKTFECGQCFRWNADSHGVYTGAAYGIYGEIWEEAGSVYVKSDAPVVFWHRYFDLDTDYKAAEQSFSGIPYLDMCTSYGSGIRILRQEPWEALCSFIISQCNNIKRIKGIVETLCISFGERKNASGNVYYSFPSAERLAELKEADLACLHAGYRAPYIISAAQAVSSGELDLCALEKADCASAKSTLMTLNGVGNKVADCAVLFGLHHMEAFPVDVWMKRALRDHFPPDFKPESLGEFAGLAQQYIFYFTRSTALEKK